MLSIKHCKVPFGDGIYSKLWIFNPELNDPLPNPKSEFWHLDGKKNS